MNFNLKLKKIRTFRKMTQKELSEKIGLTDQHRIVQYEKGVRVPKKDLVDKMAKALDVNPYTLYDTAGRDASEMMELLFWLDEFNPSALHLFLPRKFPGDQLLRQHLYVVESFRGADCFLFNPFVQEAGQSQTVRCNCSGILDTENRHRDSPSSPDGIHQKSARGDGRNDDGSAPICGHCRPVPRAGARPDSFQLCGGRPRFCCV